MIVFKTIDSLQEYLKIQKENKLEIGFIPTMGALHKGHISLVEIAKKDKCLTVCSIFVNPAQFNEKSDFEHYPSTIAADIELLEAAACDILFLPSVKEIYPKGADAALEYSFGFLETVFEGASRPGHFKGVGKVVAILLKIVQPDALYMGNKDYQQCMVVRDLCRQLDMDKQIKFVSCPTQREPDGLAMSSRNRRLNDSQRTIAGIIYQCLVSIQSKMNSGADFNIVTKECSDLMLKKGIEPEYISLANANTLEPMLQYDTSQKIVALIAARISDIRLIDNMLLN